MCDTFKTRDGFLQFTELKDKNECVNLENITAENKVVKPNKAEKWEIEAIGQFLFEEYQNLLFGVRTEWLVRKCILRAKYVKFIANAKTEVRQRLLEANTKYGIGTLLNRTNYLINTNRDSPFYRIRTTTFFEYTNKLLEEFDEKQKNGQSTEIMSNGEECKTAINGDPALTGSLEVDENAPTHELLYEGSQLQLRIPSFQLTNMGCYICQKNFISPNDFEEHVLSHGDESDFKILEGYEKCATPIFKLSYNICKNSHYFRFNLESLKPNIVIEKLVIVQTRTFYYVNNTRVPYALDANRKDSFFVDSHLFRKGVVQPIVVVFHEASLPMHNVEQHHFCRIEEFPVVHLNINPCRLPNKITFKPKFKLPQYMPPVEIRRALQKDSMDAPLAELSNEFRDYMLNKKTLTHHNAREVVLKLLQIEDWDTMREYSSLVQRNVQLRTYENDYILKLKLPKNIRFENIIFPYDDVIVLPAEESNVLSTSIDELMKKMEQLVDETAAKQQTAQKKTKKYIGQIECISYGRVTFKCQQKIPSDKLYTIIFRPSRLVLRYQYRALEQMVAMPPCLLKELLFPDEILTRELPVFNLNLLNKTIYRNPEQLQAVKCMVNMSATPSLVPYIIFGPPGTGKTSTLVEAIYQIYMLQPRSRILITAGSNGACDEIALRLCNALSPHIERQTITRIYSRSYENRAENINETLLEYSNLYADHFLPDIDVLHSYRIVVCTLSMVGRLATGRFGKEKDGSGVFSHVFVDEVAASTEAEALVGITATITANSRLVIAGDHQQLGPILNSKRAANMGLEMSLMERLLTRECYRVDEEGNYNRQIQARLRRNYRSHPEIVKLFSEMFYKGELIAEAEPEVQQLCRDWHRAPNADYPIIFHSVFGPEQRENNSTSRYNPLEIQTVMDYVRDLLCFGIKGHKVVQSDIGIITPYKKQYIRIQEELNLRNWYQIETGAVESFQGKEKNIIIISFVRSFTNNLGFLDSRNRLNVALSRARSLLILIGNPRTLSINGDFKQIIELCQLQKTMVGAAYYENDSKRPTNKSNDATLQQLTKSMEKLNVGKAQGSNGAKSKNAKGKAKNKQAANKTKNATKANESAASVNDVLKSNNSSKFKMTQPTSVEKQRQTFELLKNCYETDGLDNLVEPRSSNGNRKNANKKKPKTEIDELFDALPTVPRDRKQQLPQHDFEIVELTTDPTEEHEEFQKRLNRLQRMSTTPKPTITPRPITTIKPITLTNPPYKAQPTTSNATILKPTLNNNNNNASKVTASIGYRADAYAMPSFRNATPVAATWQNRTTPAPSVNTIKTTSGTSNPWRPTRYVPNPPPKKSKSNCVIA
uniref:Putative helicase mov-10-B.1 n=1 Tax=Zeugodacus cucurbitae TaxID=28588 RepID=A0A0A1WWI7_ZEUCU